jgi:hypothetical protein
MSRMSQTGSTIASLYEIETTFDEVVADLGLAPMSAEVEETVRSGLGVVIGRGLDEFAASPTLNPHGKLKVEDITTLGAIARNLQAAEQSLRGCETGLQTAHNIEVAKKVRAILAVNPEIGDLVKADKFLSDCCDRLKTISHACLVAAQDLRSTKGKAGRKQLDWFDDFTAILMSIAEQNGIRPTIITDRKAHKVQGRFLDLAGGFERLLWPTMRSKTRTALAKRLSRALSRLHKRQGKPPAEEPRTKSPSR